MQVYCGCLFFFKLRHRPICFLFASRGCMQAPNQKSDAFSPQNILWGDTLHLLRKWRFMPFQTLHAKDDFFYTVGLKNKLMPAGKMCQIQPLSYLCQAVWGIFKNCIFSRHFHLFFNHMSNLGNYSTNVNPIRINKSQRRLFKSWDILGK